MYREVSKLLLYSNINEDSILKSLCRIFEASDKGELSDRDAVSGIYVQMKRLLDTATAYAFDGNLWQNYLTFLILTNENSFSLASERGQSAGNENGSVYAFAKADFAVFRKLFHWDFSAIEKKLEIRCFSVITDYQAISKRQCLYNNNVSEKVRCISEKIAAAKDETEIFDIVIEHYRACGVGMFGLNRAFRIGGAGDVQDTAPEFYSVSESREIRFIPINNADTVRMKDIVGYELQKAELDANTRAFVEGRRANNVLLYGDAGTGKSTSIKAILNEYYDQGLRMIEIYKYQFRELSAVISRIKKRNYKFIIYIDDLSFEADETEYKFLKAVIEGGVETRPDNILIYATSNRRHLIKENWSDKNDMEHEDDVHRSDTVQEKLSLSARFGININYSAPRKDAYLEIVSALAYKAGIVMDEDRLFLLAERWEMRHGGRSGRAAQQFVDYLSANGDNDI